MELQAAPMSELAVVPSEEALEPTQASLVAPVARLERPEERRASAVVMAGYGAQLVH